MSTTDSTDRDELGLPQGRAVPGERLYRYRAFDATELRLLLVAGQIRFANANHLNDPWDCRPRFEAPQPRDAADLERIIAQFVGSRLRQIPGSGSMKSRDEPISFVTIHRRCSGSTKIAGENICRKCEPDIQSSVFQPRTSTR